MDNVIDFLTSTEMMVVVIVALVAILLCLIIYIFDKNCEKRKQKQNTKELKKLVSETTDDIIPEKKEKVEKIEPPKVEADTYQESPIIVEKETETIEEKKEEEPEIIETISPIKEMTLDELKEDEVKTDIEVKPDLEITAKIATIKDNEVTYTTNEPSAEDARDEIARITEMLEQEAEKEDETIETTIQIYEENQEKNAIISMQELLERTKELEMNKEKIALEEQTAPISIDEFKQAVTTEEVKESPLTEAIAQVTEPVIMTSNEEINIEDMKQNQSVTDNIERDKLAFASKFKSSPIISPIYGVEKSENDSLRIENTANYEKLDAEIKKTNEFLTKLKELQKKLD